MSIQRVGIIGAGNVGMAAAFALFVQKNCSEIVLVDVDETRTRGEALDLMHGQAYVGRIIVQAGDYSDLAGCQIVVVTAGASQKPGESRLDLLNRNAKIFRSIAEGLDKYAPDAIVVVASNPVDVLTIIMQRLSARPHHRVIGTGTMLDTTRFRSLLGEYYSVSPRSVHGYILGEHGDSEFAAWSTLTIGGKSPVRSAILGIPWNDEDMDNLVARVRNSAYEIIEAKGYTNWAIGMVISTLVGIILDNRRSIEPVSSLLTGQYGISDVCLSVPTLVGADGVCRQISLNLEQGELAALEESAALLQEVIAEVDI
ncbi:MAG: L-lactate dehydrogenase [Woeseiaceae bacterium]|nr:L-lactate dehydrogenase [Woeseiaceae bacterium]